tara:strand:+ start:210 stop:596 length:387 start_codon:yes stop_codon:yes gene_type:complete
VKEQNTTRKLTFAVDFDGCITEYKFPEIGEQTNLQKKFLNVLNKLQIKGHKIILWTSRGEPALSEAIEWCKQNGLIFDAHQVNPFFKKVSGPSPKIVADFYIDDKALEFGDKKSREKTIKFLEDFLYE